MTTLPDLKGPRPLGASTCSSEYDGVWCQAPAIRHVEWLTGDTSRACEQHWNSIKGKWRFRDSHEFGGVCDIPGSDWVRTSQEHEGYCALPPPRGAEFVGEIEVPMEANA